METKVKRTNNMRTSSKKLAWYIFLILLTLISLVPFYIMLIDCTHTNGEIASKLWLLPGTSLLDNYHRLVESVPIWRGFANSLFIAVAVTAVSGYFSALTAYGFSRYKFKGNKILYGIV